MNFFNIIKTSNSKNLSSKCNDLENIYTLKDLYIYFYNNYEILFKYPKDIATMFYWSMLAYNKPILRQGLFDNDNYKLYMKTFEYNSPFIYTCVFNNKIIICLRGTDKNIDFIKYLYTTSEIKIPQNILNKFNISIESLEKIANTTHVGILNHALKSLSMISDILPINKNIEIYLYGHSLGAACSVIISHLLLISGYKNIFCYILSCPSIFSKECPVIVNNTKKYYHIYNKGDPIVEKTGLNGIYGLLYENNNKKINNKLETGYSINIDPISSHITFTKKSKIFNKLITCIQIKYNNINICKKKLKNIEEDIINDIKFY